jgi:type IV pilus assembly protein PilA
MRRAKTSEARVQIAKMFDSAAAYFNAEHVDRGATDLIGNGGAITDMAPHRCPHESATPTGPTDSLTTPLLTLDCNTGPGGRCVPFSGAGGGPGYYDIDAWNDSNTWNGLSFQQEQGHFFHYRFVANNAATGFGNCQFTSQAFGDLDADATFSTYERSGAADQNGINGAAGLYIDQEVE